LGLLFFYIFCEGPKKWHSVAHSSVTESRENWEIGKANGDASGSRSTKNSRT